MHRRVAADVADQSARPTLEIGPGTLNHLPFEPRTSPYDIVEPFTDLYADSVYRHRVRTTYHDIRQIPKGIFYQRILSIATFEHVLDLPLVVARCGLLLAEGGRLRVGIPSEGGTLWLLAYRATTGYAFKRRYGLDYEVYLRHEHVNTALEIGDVLRCFFRRVDVRSLGVGHRWSFYQFLSCADPDRARCAAYWNELRGALPGASDALS